MRSIDVIKKITAMKARQNLGEVLEEVYYKGDQYVIERSSPSHSLKPGKHSGRPFLARLMSYESVTARCLPNALQRK
jgi:hypothetical protein